MPTQILKEKQTSKTEVEETEVEAADLVNPELEEEIEDMLAEIDEAIGELGTEFAMEFVQQGGE